MDVRLWETASTGANYIRFATDAGAVAMNFSWGGDYDQNLNDAVNYALSRDVIIVAAGPEDGTRVTKDYPTDYNRVEIITVNSHDRSGNLMQGGSTGPWVDVSAPGVNILTTTDNFGLDDYDFRNGTSYAAPQLTAIAAIIKNLTNLPPNEIRDVITDAAQDRGSFGYDETFGWGIVNGFAAVAEALSRAEDQGYNPEVTVVGDINLSTGEDIGGGLTIVSGTRTNERIYVLPNSSLTLGDVTLDGTKIFVLGRLTANATTLTLKNGAEIFCRPGSSAPSDVCNLNVDNLIVESNGCIMVNKGATAKVTGNLTVRDTGFLALFGGTVVLQDDAILDYQSAAAPLMMGSGTTFSLGQNAQIIARRPLDFRGTLTEPIRFQRSGSYAWKELSLLADSNYFENVVFDGGTKTVEVVSKNNTFKNCRFKNGWRGISSNYATGTTTRSSFTLDNSIVENNSSVGVGAYHSDPTISYTTVQSNGQAGIWLTDAAANDFHRNVVENNGTTSSRSGVEVNSGSYIDTDNGGRNRFKSNSHHEVFVASGGTAFLGSHFGDAYGSIYDPMDASTDAERFIYNGSSGTVEARFTYWGSSTEPASGHFYGSVWRIDWLTEDHTGGSGVPLMLASADAKILAVLEKATSSLASVSLLETNDASADRNRILRERMVQIREALSANPIGIDNYRLLWDLFGLQLRDRADVLGERAANMAVIAAARERLITLESTSGLSAPARHAVQESGEAAVLLELRDVMWQENYAVAAQRVKNFGSLIQGRDNKRNLLLEQVFLFEREGRFAEALDVFEQFEAIEPEDVARPDYTPADYSILEEALREKTAEAGASKAFLPDFKPAAESLALPEKFELGAAYPNPFNPQTTIPVQPARSGSCSDGDL